MSDSVTTGLQLPNLTTGKARNATSGFVRLYFKNGDLYGVDPSGNDTKLTGAGSLELADISNVNPALNPTDGQVLVWDEVNGYWTAETVSTGGLSNVVEDTTPQLGGNLDLNSFDINGTGNITITGEVNATQVQLSGGTGDDGTLSWNTDENTLDLIEGATTLQIGQEVVYNVRNNSGSTIADGTPVMATGTLGASGRITIGPMDGTNPANAKFYLGVATEEILNDADGKVTHFGKVRGIDTSIWDEGDVLWISTDTVGAFTTAEPNIGIKIPTAFVLNSTNNGTIVVRVPYNAGLLDLSDVLKETLGVDQDGYALVWDNGSSNFTFADVTTVTFSNISENSVLVSGEAVNSQDDQLMSALAIQDYVSSYVTSQGFLTEVSEADVTQYQANLSINESQITFTSSFIELGDLDVLTVTASGSGALSYNNANGSFTFTPPDLSSYLTSEVNDLSTTVTWTTVPDQFISNTSVVQHQGDLSITESQISDLGTYIEDANLQAFLDAFTLPVADGTTGQVLSTNGTGTLSFTTVTAGGTDTLDDVTGRGNTTTNDITVGSLVASNNVSADSIDVTSYIDFAVPDPNVEPAWQEGRVYYNEEYNTLSVYNDISSIQFELGLEEYVRVFNNTASTISKGTPCRPAGVQGENQRVAPADATSQGFARVLGVAAHDIPAATFGYCLVRGLLGGVDTTGLTAGGPVWLAPDGSLSTAAPTYPYFPTQVGGCIIVDGTNGYLYVSPTYLTISQLRVVQNGHIDGNLTIDGDLTINGTQTITLQNNLAIGDAFIYLNSGDVIGDQGTTFTGTGLDDATFKSYFEGTSITTFSVRIDGVGTGTGGADTFEWSIDGFSTTVATGVDITGNDQDLQDNIKIFFNATTGHTLGDTWEGTASPLNVDSGWTSNRNTGTSGIGYTHMGVFFDASDEKFKFFDQYGPEPEGTIDVTDPTYSTGTIVANLEGNVTGNASTASSAAALTTARNITLQGDVTGSASFDGSADATITATIPEQSLTLTDVTITGDLTVQGTTTTVNSETLSSQAPLIILNDGGQTEPDIGLIGEYNDGTDRIAGIFRDASDNGIFKFFENSTQTVTDTSVINEGATGYTLAPIEALSFTGEVDFSNLINLPDPVVTVTIGGDIVGTADATLTNLGNGTASITASVNSSASFTLADLTITNDLNVFGTTTTVNQATLTVSDSKIFLADGNPSDAIDGGVFINYFNGSDDKTAGFFRDVTNGNFVFFSAYSDALNVGTTINKNDPEFVGGTIEANIIGNVVGDVTGQVSTLVNFDTDDLAEGATNRYFTTANANTAIDNRVTAAFVDALGVNYNTLANLPTIPSVLTDLGITDGTQDQVLSTDGAGNFTFVDQTGGGGVFQPIKLDPIVTVNGQSDYTMQISGVNHDPASDFALLVSLNGVIQEPGNGFNTVGTTITFIPALQTGDVVDFIIDLGNAVDVTEVVSTDTLDDVVTRGSSTTSTITAGGFATTTGTSSEFLKADGSVDSSTYLTTETNDLSSSVTWTTVPDGFISNTSVVQHQGDLSITESQISDLQTYLTAESDTLDSVTGRGATTTNGITVGSIDINGEIIELTRNATGINGSTALDPALGTIQRLVLSGATTFTDSLANGESITLLIDDGTGNTITWPTTLWVGGSAPTLDTTNDTIVTVWKINNTLYGALVGVAS